MTGARVDKSLFETLGMNVDSYGDPRLSSAMESSIDGVYVVGDCRKGPSTVVAAMGDAKKAALDILEKEALEHDFVHVEVPVDEPTIVERRGELVAGRLPSEEGLRCMCNECGNCATFCPHAGKPYKDKLTVFWSEADFADSENIGFLKLTDQAYRIRDERGRVFDALVHELEAKAGKEMTAVITAVTTEYPWLLNNEH